MRKLHIGMLALCMLAVFVFTGCDNGSSNPQYQVSFDLNWCGADSAGMGNVTAPEPVWFKAIGQSITLPQVLDKDGNIYATENGYYVDTWYKDRDLTQSAGSALTGEARFTPEDSCTLYANWTRRTVTLCWNLNYPSGMSVPASEIEKCHNTRATAGTALASSDIPVPAELSDGTTFAGWFDNPENGEGSQFVANTTKVPFEGRTYYAQWKYPVTVTYKLPGGSVYAIKNQKAYDAVDMPATPSQVDVPPCFAGWFDESDNMLYEGDIIKRDAVYTAKAGYTLKIKDRNSAVADGQAGVERGVKAFTIITEPDDSANGKYVKGYYADSTCTTKVAYNDGKLLPNVNGLTDSDGRWIGNNSAVLYADWKDRSKIGSKLVFYIDKENGRSAKNYKFYDSGNNLLTVIEDSDNDYGITFSGGGDPATYAYYGEGRDRYYVVNDTLDKANKYTWAYYTDSSTYKEEIICVKPEYKAIGVGRANTAEIMARDGGKYINDNDGTGKNPTVWYALDQLNKGLMASPASNGGCSDWFVPSINELLKMPRLVKDSAWTASGKTGKAPKGSDQAWEKLKTYVSGNASEWSSSGASATTADFWYFDTSDKGSTSKGNFYFLAAVRAF